MKRSRRDSLLVGLYALAVNLGLVRRRAAAGMERALDHVAALCWLLAIFEVVAIVNLPALVEWFA